MPSRKLELAFSSNRILFLRSIWFAIQECRKNVLHFCLGLRLTNHHIINDVNISYDYNFERLFTEREVWLWNIRVLFSTDQATKRRGPCKKKNRAIKFRARLFFETFAPRGGFEHLPSITRWKDVFQVTVELLEGWRCSVQHLVLYMYRSVLGTIPHIFGYYKIHFRMAPYLNNSDFYLAISFVVYH
jgi:hypothetical protein